MLIFLRPAMEISDLAKSESRLRRRSGVSRANSRQKNRNSKEARLPPSRRVPVEEKSRSFAAHASLLLRTSRIVFRIHVLDHKGTFAIDLDYRAARDEGEVRHA